MAKDAGQQFGNNQNTAGNFPPVFEPGCFAKDGRFTFVKRPALEELPAIYDLAMRGLGREIAPSEVVERIYAYNPLSFWGVYRSADATRQYAILAGYFAYLPLSEAGLSALKANRFDGQCPDAAHLAGSVETTAALYIWSIVAHGVFGLGSRLVSHAIGLDRLATFPIYGRVATNAGRHALQNSRDGLDADLGSLFELPMPEELWQQLRAMEVLPRSQAPALETALVSTPEQIQQVFAIRAAVYLIEQHCPYDEEFDGNDYAGSHVLGLVDGEPAAVLRIRYFADFAKLERWTVLPRFRRTGIGRLVVERAIDHCRRKGYRKMYGHSQARLVDKWRAFGFEPMSKNTSLVYSDHAYIEMIGEFAPHSEALTPYSDPLLLVRPEGQWDRPGVLDLSSERPVTNPH